MEHVPPLCGSAGVRTECPRCVCVCVCARSAVIQGSKSSTGEGPYTCVAGRSPRLGGALWVGQAQPWRSRRGGPAAWRSFGLAAGDVCVVCLFKASWGLHTLPSPGRTWLGPASVGRSGFLGLPEAGRGLLPSPLPPLPEFLAAAGGVPTWFLLGGGAVAAEFWLSSAQRARRLAGGIGRGRL